MNQPASPPPEPPVRRTGTAEEEFDFVPATKAQSKARLAFAGPSGSGKTYTALKVATGLVAAGAGTPSKSAIAVIDTEHGSASKYADLFPFTTLKKPMTNFDPRRLVRALASAAAAGVQVMVIDSLSHFWTGQGGMLEQVDAAGRRTYGGNSFGGWKEAAPMERAMIDAMLAFPGHVIVTMRTKTEYTIEKNLQGQNVPRKVGLKPVQRDGIEYEFDVVGDLDLSNTLTISKSRCPELSGQVIQQPGLQVAQQVLEWLEDGTPTQTATELRAAAAAPTATKAVLRALYTQAQELRLSSAQVIDDQGRAVTLADYITYRGHQAPEDPPPPVGAQADPAPPLAPNTRQELADGTSGDNVAGGASPALEQPSF